MPKFNKKNYLKKNIVKYLKKNMCKIEAIWNKNGADNLWKIAINCCEDNAQFNIAVIYRKIEIEKFYGKLHTNDLDRKTQGHLHSIAGFKEKVETENDTLMIPVRS